MKESGRPRSLHRHGTALLVGIATLLSIVLAPVVQASVQHATKSTPKPGGTVSYWNGATPDCVDPQKTGLSASFGVFSKVVDPLISIDEKGKFKPNLALSWKISNGGRTFTLNLRKGVKFSNGHPFNAQAVKYTFDRAANPATKSPVTAGNLANITNTKVVNAYTVRLTLKDPSRVLLTNLASAYTGILDPKASQQQGNGSCTAVIGTGPYKIQSVTPDLNQFTLVRNTYRNWEPPWYHNHGKPYLDKIVAKAFTSDATAISEFLAGQMDIATIPGSQIDRVKGQSGIYLKTLPAQNLAFIGFNMSKAPFDNLEVRKAFAESIDRSAIIKAAYNGLGKVDYSAIPPSIADYDKNAQTYGFKYNPSDAQRIFQANHVTGPYDFLVFSNTTAQAAAEIVQGELAQVGVKLNIIIKPISDFLSQAAKGQYDVDWLSYGYNDPDVMYLLFHSSQGGGHGLNLSFMPSALAAQIDTYLVQGREATNPKKAKAAYASAQKLLITQGVIFPIATSVSPTAFKNRVQGLHTNVSGQIAWADLYVTK